MIAEIYRDILFEFVHDLGVPNSVAHLAPSEYTSSSPDVGAINLFVM